MASVAFVGATHTAGCLECTQQEPSPTIDRTLFNGFSERFEALVCYITPDVHIRTKLWNILCI